MIIDNYNIQINSLDINTIKEYENLFYDKFIIPYTHNNEEILICIKYDIPINKEVEIYFINQDRWEDGFLSDKELLMITNFLNTYDKDYKLAIYHDFHKKSPASLGGR